MLIIEDDAVLMLLTLQSRHNLIGFLRHVAVHILTLFVVLVDMLCLTESLTEVALHQEVHALLSVLHPATGIDARPYFEDDITHGDIAPAKPTDIDDGLKTHTRILIQLFQSMESQYAVLIHNRNKVGSNADGTEIEQGDKA